MTGCWNCIPIAPIPDRCGVLRLRRRLRHNAAYSSGWHFCATRSFVSLTFRSSRVAATAFKECSTMTDYVLVHGAWHGSWCWARVRRLLTAAGHQVFTPTLTGVGERSHLLSRDIGL